MFRYREAAGMAAPKDPAGLEVRADLEFLANR
jgi:hypothetical protein